MSKTNNETLFEQRQEWLASEYTAYLRKEFASKEAPLFELLLRAAQSSADPAVRAAATRIECHRQLRSTFERDPVEESDE